MIPRTQIDWGAQIAEQVDYLRYVHGIGWHVWDDQRWKPDDDGEASRVYVRMVKESYAQLGSLGDEARKRVFRSLQQAERKSSEDGALHFASVHENMAVAAPRLDARRMLLNCANGTLDLDTMDLLPHNPAHMITKVCRGRWISSIGESRWSKFTAEIFPDAEVREFVQRLMGSTLPGRVRDHLLPIFTGTGANGKSTFIETVLWALGDYGMQADPRLMMASAHDAHPTGQAALQGRRLAVCMETAQGRKLDAATAKQLTGGDTITARYMRKDFFSFEPSHSLIMVTNHKPVVSGSDEALWRRLVVVPFEQKFTDRADAGLKDQLQSEPDAVLSWMVQGWLAYRDQGLRPPATVQAATDTYKADSDAVGRFLTERTHPGVMGRVVSSVLFAAWQRWCQENGEEPGNQKAFSEELTHRGFEKRINGGRMVWHGFSLLSEPDANGGEGR